jgi:hypothetical protein
VTDRLHKNQYLLHWNMQEDYRKILTAHSPKEYPCNACENTIQYCLVFMIVPSAIEELPSTYQSYVVTGVSLIGDLQMERNSEILYSLLYSLVYLVPSMVASLLRRLSQ